jgi:hypothetical protein
MPNIGTRWDCPTCGTAYFAFWRDAKWDNRLNEWGSGFVIDLSYYESFNDEHYIDEKGNIEGLDDPAYLCLDDAGDVQWVW